MRARAPSKVNPLALLDPLFLSSRETVHGMAASRKTKAVRGKEKISHDERSHGIESGKPVRQDFARAVWRMVATIPQGRVTTYGKPLLLGVVSVTPF